jgi:hypothetical protein
MALICDKRMSDLETTQECPVFDPEADEITLRERCVSIINLDGSVQLIRIEPPVLPAPDQIKRLAQDSLEDAKKLQLQYPLTQIFDTFLYQLFEKYAGEFRQTMYRGLAEQGIKIAVEVDYESTSESRIISYQLICTKNSPPITITPKTNKWSAFLDKTEVQIKTLCHLHLTRKAKQKTSERNLAAEVAPGNKVSSSVSQTLVSARLTAE